MSPNVEQNQPHETTSVKQPSPDEESHHPVKVARKEDVTPKSETAQVGVKENQLNQILRNQKDLKSRSCVVC